MSVPNPLSFFYDSGHPENVQSVPRFGTPLSSRRRFVCEGCSEPFREAQNSTVPSVPNPLVKHWRNTNQAEGASLVSYAPSKRLGLLVTHRTRLPDVKEL